MMAARQVKEVDVVAAAAGLALVLLLGLSMFQVLLIAGAPWGRLAWGGRHEVLPPALRFGSAVSLVVYAFCAVVIADEGGLVDLLNGSWPRTAVRVVSGYFFLGIVVNALSRSRPERLVMTPAAAALALLFLVVALQP